MGKMNSGGRTGSRLSMVRTPRRHCERRSPVSDQFRKIADDDIGTVLAERVAVAFAVYADHEAEVSRAARLDAADRVLDDDGSIRLRAKQLGSLEERIRRGLAAQVHFFERDPIDAHVKQVIDLRGTQHRPTVPARRDDAGAEALI